MAGVSSGARVDCSVDEDVDGVGHNGESKEGNRDCNSSGVKSKDSGDRL